MIILAAVLVSAIAYYWVMSTKSEHETETQKIAVRTNPVNRKNHNSRVIDD